MYSKYNEIEALVESVMDDTIVQTFGDLFSTKKECCVALDMLIEKLSEMDCTVFDDYYDN